MSRPIDADALIAELQKDEERFDKEAENCRKNSRNYTDCYMQAMSSRADGIRDAIIEVYDAPTIDAVEVVRCKDCKWHTSDDECIAPKWDFEERVVYPTTYSDDFCSYGERKNDGDNH